MVHQGQVEVQVARAQRVQVVVQEHLAQRVHQEQVARLVVQELVE